MATLDGPFGKSAAAALAGPQLSIVTAADNGRCFACADGYDSSMRSNELAELTAFVAVAEACSFRRAAARLDLKPSTLSHSLRSEEHTSELQSLMRISYAVFCLKKKTSTHQIHMQQKQY